MLVSARFSGDPVLEACAAGTHRMLAPEAGPAVGKVQQALVELGFDLPTSHVDERFGQETGNAVTAFKVSRNIQPSDPVVGVKTMAALDAAFADLVLPPEPAEVPIGADPFARRPEGEARVPAARAIIEAFRANPAGSNWLHLDRNAVGMSTDFNVTFPDTVQQGGNGLCSSAAFVNLWAQDAPDAYAAFATALFNDGAADIASAQGTPGALRITAGNDLLAADYPRIADRMRQRGFPIPSQSDWMVLSALRDSSNLVADFTGDPDDWVSHTFGDGSIFASRDLVAWMRASGMYREVRNEVNALITKEPSHATMQLNPATSRCVLSVDTRMIQEAQARHDMVLRSRVLLNEDGSVDLRAWTWAQVESIRVDLARFADNYYGAVVGVL